MSSLTATAWSLATDAVNGQAPPPDGDAGLQIITPSWAELLLPAIAFALIAAVAAVVIWLIVRAVSRTSDDLAVQVARLEAENHELRLEVDALRREHV